MVAQPPEQAPRLTSAQAVEVGVRLPTALAVMQKLNLKDKNEKRRLRRAWHGHAGIDVDQLELICDAYGWDDWKAMICLREMARRRRMYKKGHPYDPKTAE